MQRYLMLATAAAAFGALAVTPGHAATSDAGAKGGDMPQQLIRSAVKTVQNAELDHHLTVLMQHAKGVFIVPHYKQGALIIGASGGHGVLLSRVGDTWSDPAFYSVGALSIGAQAGGQAGSVIMLLMSNQALRDFETAHDFSLNGKAGLTAGTYSAKAKVGTNTDVIVWSNTQGASGGISVGGSEISQDVHLDHRYYGQNVTAAEILHGNTNNLSADKLRKLMPT